MTYPWIRAAHMLGVLFWVGGLFSVYWLLRIHSHAPKDAHEQLTLMERSLALMMDIAAALAIGCGVAMIVSPNNMLTMPHMGWLHLKLTLVVIGILPVHGMIRARVKKFSRGENPSVPQRQWSMLLAAVVAIVILVVMRPF